MTEKKIIDVHCHLFNGQYAVMELAAATWNVICGDYPHEKGKREYVKTKKSILALEGVRELALWTARLIKAVASDCEDNYIYGQKKFHESSFGEEASLIVVPLMMDIYYALDDNKGDSKLKSRQQSTLFKPFRIQEKQKDNFHKHLNNIKQIVIEEFQKLPKGEPESTDSRTGSLLMIDTVFQDAKNALLNISSEEFDRYALAGIEMSPGYKKHMHDLEELSRKYPDKVFPFLAVDPRKIGVMKLIEKKINRGNGVFKGLKIYPPLGYLPTHPNLIPIFEYCSENDIPITVHCGFGGFPNLRKENFVTSWDTEPHIENFKSVDGNKSRYYANPENWIPVLKRWPELRINFGHFGGGDITWMNTIIKLMENHPNIYADTSYFTKKGIALEINDLIKRNEILKKRLMFGTDYVMIMLNMKLGGLEAYFNNYSGLSNELLGENARGFLKINYL